MIRTALEMPLAERRARHEALMAAVRKHDVAHWCRVVPGAARARAVRRRARELALARVHPRRRWRSSSRAAPTAAARHVAREAARSELTRRCQRRWWTAQDGDCPDTQDRPIRTRRKRRDGSIAGTARADRPRRSEAARCRKLRAKRWVDRHVHRAAPICRARAGHAHGAAAPFTLGVDIGGTNIKASVLDRGRRRLPPSRCARRRRSPRRRRPCCEAIAELAAQLPSFHRISVGFPGVVKGGKVVTAPNLGTEHWAGFQLIEALAEPLRHAGAHAQRCGRAGPGRGRGPRARVRADAGHGRRLRPVSQPPPAAAPGARPAPRPQAQDLRSVHRPGGAGGERARSAGTGACARRSTP